MAYGPISSPQIALLRSARRNLTAAVESIQLAYKAQPGWELTVEQSREFSRKALTWTDEAIDVLVSEERERRELNDTAAEIDLLVSNA